MDHQAIAQLLGNYGEFVGAIVVVITLGYLVVQVNQNTKAYISELPRGGHQRKSVRFEAPEYYVVHGQKSE